MTLHAVEIGNAEAEPIVFLHGAGVAGWMWTDIATNLSDYRSVLLDLPGHGNSAEIVPQSLVDMADRVADDIARRFGCVPVNVVGLSLGGMMTVLLAARHPQLVKRALASGVNALPIPNVWTLRLMMRAMAAVVRRDFYIQFNAKQFGVPDDDYAQFYASAKKLNVDVFKMVGREALNFRVPDNGAQVDIPVLFVAGENEHPVNVASVTALAEAIPHAAGALAQEGGHMWSAENPTLFTAMIRAWLADAPLPDGLSVVVPITRQKVASIH